MNRRGPMQSGRYAEEVAAGQDDLGEPERRLDPEPSLEAGMIFLLQALL